MNLGRHNLSSNCFVIAKLQKFNSTSPDARVDKEKANTFILIWHHESELFKICELDQCSWHWQWSSQYISFMRTLICFTDGASTKLLSIICLTLSSHDKNSLLEEAWWGWGKRRWRSSHELYTSWQIFDCAATENLSSPRWSPSSEEWWHHPYGQTNEHPGKNSWLINLCLLFTLQQS